jgi:hypothetical protein
MLAPLDAKERKARFFHASATSRGRDELGGSKRR